MKLGVILMYDSTERCRRAKRNTSLVFVLFSAFPDFRAFCVKSVLLGGTFDTPYRHLLAGWLSGKINKPKEA